MLSLKADVSVFSVIGKCQALVCCSLLIPLHRAEAAAQVLFISKANVASYPTRQAAEHAFALALAENHVRVRSS